MGRYNPMSDYLGKIVDCRMLHMELEFCLLAKKQRDQLAQLFFRSITDLLAENFFIKYEWEADGVCKAVCADSLDKNIVNCDGGFTISAEGDVISPYVYNLKSFRAYQKLLEANPGSTASVDYMNYTETLKEKTDADYVDIVQQIFHNKNRIYRSTWSNHDFQTMFFSVPQRNSPEKYMGNISFHIAVPCLGKHIDWFSEQLASFLLQAAQCGRGISGRVLISPIEWPSMASPHMRYFAGPIKPYCFSGYGEVEQYKSFFCCGAEWFNLISEIQSKHDPHLLENAKTHFELSAETVSGRAITIRTKKPISILDTEDLLPIKKAMYPLLYPGGITYSFNVLFNGVPTSFFTHPRFQWETVPIFEDEISVIGNSIKLSHCSSKER